MIQEEFYVGAVKVVKKNLPLYTITNFLDVDKLLGDENVKNLRV